MDTGAIMAVLVTDSRRLVYVSGAPGSGKTSLAAPLAAELGYPLLSKDRIKETLHDALGAPGPDLAWSRMLGGAAMELLWALAADAPAVVIEANFRPYSEYERAKLCGLSAQPVEVHCACPLELALQRYNARVTHPVHVVTTLELHRLARRRLPGHRRRDLAHRRSGAPHERDLRAPRRHPAARTPRPGADLRRGAPARCTYGISDALQHGQAAPGIAQHVPDSDRDAPRATVTDIDTQRIRRKPVLNGLINEYRHAV